MEFEWDGDKNELNIRKHGIDFADSVVIFDEFTYSVRDNRESYGEIRLLALGNLFGIIVVVCYTDRGEKRRIISIRKAEKDEAEQYRKQKKRQTGK